MALSQNETVNYVGHWAEVNGTLDITIKQSGTITHPLLILTYDGYENRDDSSVLKPREYRLTRQGPYKFWTAVERSNCQIKLMATTSDKKDDVYRARVSFSRHELWSDGKSLSDWGEYCENHYEPSTCSLNDFRELIYRDLDKFFCHRANGRQYKYTFKPSKLTFQSLNGKWSAASGILKSSTGERIAKGARLFFSSTENSFSIEYGVCDRPGKCVEGKDIFHKIDGRITDGAPFAKCEKEDGTIVEKNLGTIKNNKLFLSLPDRSNRCSSDASPTVSISKHGKDDELTLEVKEVFEGNIIQGNADLLKNPDESN